MDKRYATCFGFYQTDPRQNHTHCFKPQENYSDCGCSYLKVRSKSRAFFINASVPSSFNLSPYTQKELTIKKHNYERMESDGSVLCVDYKMSGIGPNSCGSALKSQYRFIGKANFNLSLILFGDS